MGKLVKQRESHVVIRLFFFGFFLDFFLGLLDCGFSRGSSDCKCGGICQECLDLKENEWSDTERYLHIKNIYARARRENIAELLCGGVVREDKCFRALQHYWSMIPSATDFVVPRQQACDLHSVSKLHFTVNNKLVLNKPEN